ncbi:MAG: FAD-binding oxidoreductase [Chloroflexota bacterium]
MTHQPDVIICGAGSAGVAAAYYLATNHQITNTLLIDKHAPLSQTSAKSGENIRAWWPVQPMIDLANRSMELMEQLALETNNAINLEKRGYAYATKDVTSLKPYLEHYQTLDVGEIRFHNVHTDPNLYVPPYQPEFDDPIGGADVLYHKPIIEETFPHFSSNIEAVVHARRAGSVSMQQLGMVLLDEAKRLGARELRGEVVGIETTVGTKEKRICAVNVQTEAGIERIKTETFINAAGPFVGQLAQMIGVDLPIQTVFQQKIAFQDIAGIIPRDAPFTIYLDKQHLEWSSDERRDLEGDSNLASLLDEFPGGFHIKPEGTGDSTWIKLGWACNQRTEQPQWDPQGEPEFPEIMMRGASRLVPELNQYIHRIPKPLVHYGGYYTKTTENLPLVGPLEVPGAYIVGALSGFGTMMSCATGELVAAWVAGSRLPTYAGIFSAGRYEDCATLDSLRKLAQQGEL